MTIAALLEEAAVSLQEALQEAVAAAMVVGSSSSLSGNSSSHSMLSHGGERHERSENGSEALVTVSQRMRESFLSMAPGWVADPMELNGALRWCGTLTEQSSGSGV